MVGFHGLASLSDVTAGPFIKSLGARCQDRTGLGAISTIPAVGIAGDPFGPFDCPAGQAVVGVVGGAGAVLDSVALVCGALPVVPTITSVSPAAPVAPGAGQMLTILGTNLPPGSTVPGAFPREIEQQVVFNQGGLDIFANLSSFTWSGSASRWVVRLPTTLAAGPATVRLTNPGATVTTNSFPIDVSFTPAAPILTAALNQCSGGTPISSVTAGAPFAIEAEGIDTFGGQVVWTPVSPVGGAVLTQGGLTATAGPSGRVCLFPAGGAPTLSSGTTYSLQVRTTVGFNTSALSNGITITVTVP
jgi:hypothetical protein